METALQVRRGCCLYDVYRRAGHDPMLGVYAMMKQCATCIHWLPVDRATAYLAPCALSYQRTRFDEGCDRHEGPQPLGQQSQVRGFTSEKM